MNYFFSKAKKIESNIDRFLDNIITASLSFEEGLNDYYNSNEDAFIKRCAEIDKLESDSDVLRREIKVTLYKELLIPDARGDVLGLLETLDNVIDRIKKVIQQFSIESPIICKELKDDFLSLVRASVKCVTELVSAARAFFREIQSVDDYLIKVHFWEHEADQIEDRIKRKTFKGDFIEDLSQKVHVRYFAEKISSLADDAEAVAERLAVYTIKREI
ncbi:MAG: DUF47 family protein [Spirochaetales bacterium]|nr:DUF47 family protein [Spirochaetales bacterium]